MFIFLFAVSIISTIVAFIFLLYILLGSNLELNSHLIIPCLVQMIISIFCAVIFFQLDKMKKQIKSNEEEKMRMNLEIKNTQKNLKEFINNTNTEIKNLKRNIEELKSKENEEDAHLSEKDEANEKDE